ncbi:unnamed protein product [Brassica rapa]|uniref:Uncharacterized protein n=1 Tax=Brassica campestris TaxID=3711 RepID=A0A8D9FZP5_BRACM|nr:unnamed protein product [Brassica rapa]
MCVLTDTHGRLVCAGGHPWMSSVDILCVLTETHGCPPCADGNPRTSCVN